MPGKHVHFADSHSSYNTPSPSTSHSSIPSSKGPITPPSVPLLRLPSRGHTKGIATIHPLLAVAKPRAVNFDVSQHHSYISTSYLSLSSHAGLLNEPAISPPTTHMTISVPYFPSKWYIQVVPKANGAYITVSDVLRAVYYGLRVNIRAEEFNAIAGKADRDRVSAAYQARYRRIRDKRAYDEEKMGGLKRVDFLAGKNAFAGLSPNGSTWLMTVT